MDNHYKADTTDLGAFASMWLKDAPKQAQWAVARMLTTYARETRTEAINVIDAEMVVRNKAFIRKSITYDQANGRQPIALQSSHVGSHASKDFTGWIEQQLGSPTKQEHRHGTAARTGKGFKGRVRAQRRLSPGAELIKTTTIPQAVSALARVKNPKPFHAGALMLRIGQRLGMTRRLYLVPKGDRAIRPGIYWMHASGTLEWQSTLSSAENTKRLPWMTWARDKMDARVDTRALWNETMIYQLQARYRRRK
jgi:hypothetical protein